MGILRLNLDIVHSVEHLRVMAVDRDGNVLDQHDGMLRPLELAGDPLVYLTPVPPEPHLYRATLSVDDSYTGTLYPLLVDLDPDTQEIERVTRLEASWYVRDGAVQVDLLRRLATVTARTGAPPELEVLDAHGTPVEGGTVRVYEKVSWDADPVTSPILGTAIGGPDGQWLAPIYLPYGQTYVFVITADPNQPSRVQEVSL